MQRHEERCATNVFRSKLWAIVSSMYLISGFIAVGVWPVTATAQTSDFGTCTDLDPSDANSIASCLTSDLSQHFATSCGLAANNLAMALLRNRLSVDRPERDIFDAERARFSCAPLAEAYRLFTEQDVPWLGCIPDGTEGTAAHMAACISHHNSTAPANNRIQLNTLNNCAAIHTTYDRLVMSAINEMDYRPFQPEMRYAGARPDNGQVLDFQGRNASYQWIGPYGFTGMSFTDRFNTSDYFRLNSSPFPYDCSIAAEAQAVLTNSTPAWAPCIGYSPDNVVEHFAQCVPTRAQARLDCVEGRDLYENLITWANAGRRPESYRSIACDVVAAGFDRANEIQMAAAAAQRAAAQERAANAPSRSAGQASGGAGPGMILLLLLAVGGLVAFLIVKRFKGAGPAAGEENASVDGKPVFESADEDAYTLLETDDTTVITWLMWQYGTISEKNYGRFVEIKSDSIFLSEIYPLPKRKKGNQKEVTLELYRAGIWRSKAKVYDPQKITGLRIVQSKPRFGKPVAWNDTTFTVVMDYGKTHVDLNYQAKRNSEIGNFSDTDEGILRLVAVLKEAIQRRRDQADGSAAPMGAMSQEELKALSEEHGIDVTFGDDPENSTSPKSPPSSEGKKSTSDDPF